MREVVFGDIGINHDIASPDPCGGSVPKAGALVLTFLLNNYRDAEYQGLAEQWENEVGVRTMYVPRTAFCSQGEENVVVGWRADCPVSTLGTGGTAVGTCELRTLAGL